MQVLGARVAKSKKRFGVIIFLDLSKTISVGLTGAGAEARSVWIDRGQGELLIPLDSNQPPTVSSAIQFRWKDHNGKVWSAIPEISATAVKLPETGEDLPDFFFFTANQVYPSADNADRFSALNSVKDGNSSTYLQKSMVLSMIYQLNL
jgi:hypothetical protein